MNKFSTNCPHFKDCSGCSDVNIETVWNDIVFYFKNKDSKVTPKFFEGVFKESRYRAKLAIEKRKENIFIGLYKRNSHDVVDISNCEAHHRSINKAIAFIKKQLRLLCNDKSIFETGLIYDKKTKKGLLRYLQFFVEKESETVQLSFVVNESEVKNLDKLKKALKRLFGKNELFNSIWINLHQNNSNFIFSDKWVFVTGREYLFQKIGDWKFAFHPGAFSQSNVCLFEKLINVLKEEEMFFEKTLELYAGNGSIGLNLLDKTKKLTLVEINPFAKISFEKTVLKNKIETDKLFYLNKPVEDAIRLIDENDCIIADPPRKGLDKCVLERICHKKNGRFIYVSCSFKSFKKDCDELLKNGWKILKSFGFWFFPKTEHVEILAIFDKR